MVQPTTSSTQITFGRSIQTRSRIWAVTTDLVSHGVENAWHSGEPVPRLEAAPDSNPPTKYRRQFSRWMSRQLKEYLVS